MYFKYIQITVPYLKNSLYCIFILCFKNGHFPDLIEIALITHIYIYKTNNTNMNNY